MENAYYQSIRSDIADITVYATETGISRLDLGVYRENTKPNSVTQKCCDELLEYFAGKRKNFDIPLCLNATEFQKKVWQALRKIPYGKTVSYRDIAIAIGSPKACRAVGNANHNNPIPIIVPCHRVIAANGTLGGYALPIEIKQKLLEFEMSNTKKE